MAGSVLSAEALRVSLGPVDVLDGVSFSLARGETLGVVGESGCGKSMTALAAMGLLPQPHRLSGRLVFDGIELAGLDEASHRRLRGKRMAMIFQEPMTALNPVIPIGRQIAEMLEVHENASPTRARAQAVELLRQVGIASPAERAHATPHLLSGGMRQRAMIAMAIACRPDLLIADEPTTALDVSVQAQILDLLLELQRSQGMAMLFISHNLGVISAVSDQIMVMYAGRVAEIGPAADVLTRPGHPYTSGLMATMPDPSHRVAVLPTIEGQVPDLHHRLPGCAFAPRCPVAEARCHQAIPPMLGQHHQVACVRQDVAA